MSHDADIDELLEHAEWLRHLALALVGNPDDASDLTQEAIEVALTRPPQRPGPMRPWLGGVVRNLARMRRRSAGRRRDREQRAEPAAEVPTPAELVDRARAQQQVARGVLELDEPYRSTVLLRYYEGLSSAEIARRLDLPAATVRSRLKTGLDRLRADLDRDRGRDRWLALLAPLAPADRAVASTSLVKGVLIVKTSTKIAVAAVVLLIAGYLGGRYAGWWGGSPGPETVAASESDADRPAPSIAVRRAALVHPDAVNAAVSENDPAGDLRLEGQVIDAEERPVGGAVVAINSVPVRTVTTEGDGSFAFDRLIGRDYELEATAGDGYAGPVRLRLAADTEPVVLRMQTASPVTVTVVDSASRAPVAGAAVELRSHLVWSGTTGADGAVSIAGVGAGDPVVRVSAEGYAPVTRRLVTLGRGRRVEIALRGGAPVSGRVIDAGGQPVSGARVIATATSEPFPVIDPRRDGVTTGDDGRFTIGALAAGTYRLTASARGLATASSAPIACDGTTARRDVEIALPAGARLTGAVVTSAGEPVAGADVRVVATGSVSWRTARRAYTGKDGTFAVTGLSRRAFDVVASHDRGSSEIARVDLGAKESAAVELALSITGAIGGRVVDHAGEPVAEARVYAEPEWSGGVEDRAAWSVRGALFRVADSGGRFALAGLPAGRYRLRAARPGDGQLALVVQPGVLVETGAGDVELTIPAAGRISGRVVYSDGEAPAVFAIAVGAGAPVPVVSDGGRFELESPSGEHRVEVSGPSFAPKSVTATVTGGDESDLGTITVERGRSVSGRVLDRNGAPVEGAEVAAGSLLSGDGSKLFIPTESLGAKTGTTDADGRFVLAGFGPGPLTVVAGKPGVGRSSSLGLPRGRDSVTVDLVLAATGKLSGVVRRDGKPVGETIVIANPIGAAGSNFFVTTGADGSYALDALTAGQYTVFPMIGGGGPKPKDMYIRPVEIRAGETTEADIHFATGPVELALEVKTDDGTPVAMASVFVIGVEVDVSNAKALRDGGWLGAYLRDYRGSAEALPLYMRQAMGGKTTIAGMTARTYTACVVPMPVEPGDMAAMMALRDRVEELPMECQHLEIAPSPARQTVSVEVPGAWARPPASE